MGSKPPAEQPVFHVGQQITWNDAYVDQYQRETETNLRKKFGLGPFVVTNIYDVPPGDQKGAGHTQIVNLEGVPDGLSGAFFLPFTPLKN